MVKYNVEIKNSIIHFFWYHTSNIIVVITLVILIIFDTMSLKMRLIINSYKFNNINL